MLEKYALFRVLRALRWLDELSVRGCAERAGVAASAAKTHLDWLYSMHVVKRRVVGRSHLCSIDVSSPLARHYKLLFSLYELSAAKLVEELTARWPEISSIVLYGSVARGDDDAKSDIDILVISRKKIRMADLKSERALKRELTILSYTPQEWREKARRDKVFYDRVIVDSIVLYGEIPVVN